MLALLLSFYFFPGLWKFKLGRNTRKDKEIL